MYKIDLNSDLGESFGSYKIGNDKEIISLVSSANIACGFHAGDANIMEKTVRLCRENKVAVGAHPGFCDLMGFGRRNMNVSPDEIKNIMTYQVAALDGFCKSLGIKLKHVKPHGALYNMAAKNKEISKAICEGICRYDSSLVLLGLAGSEMINEAKKMGLKCASEIFADRNYEDDGTLVARTKPNAMIEDENEAIERVVEMIKKHRVKSVNGKEIEIHPDSVCVHGDGEKALVFIRNIRASFEKESIMINALE